MTTFGELLATVQGYTSLGIALVIFPMALIFMIC